MAPDGRRRCQSLVSLAQGVTMRSRPDPNSMSTAVSSSTPTTRPRPNLSWVTWSCTTNGSAGGAAGGALKGLVGKRRRVVARAGFTFSIMRPQIACYGFFRTARLRTNRGAPRGPRTSPPVVVFWRPVYANKLFARNEPQAAGNEPDPGSVVPGGRSCFVCSCFLHARGERCCGRAASASWKGRVDSRPGYRIARTCTQPL
jgi:hypothetical protein